jgi:hypothetical protein
MTIVVATQFSARAIMLTLSDNPALEAWHRIGCLAWYRTDQDGHAKFATGELARRLNLKPGQVSDALAVARRRGWVDPVSHARCVVLPGCADNPCEERHG